MSKGRFGSHGGQYIPETLMNAVIELEEAYDRYKADPEFNAELDKLLTARELVKVKIQDGSLLEAKPVANELAEMLNAEFVQAIGRKFVLYRQAPEKENRKIVLPK